jgi:ubiquinone biosynthesis monooxygenase Coq7
MARRLKRSLPGDKIQDSLERMIRVDHAGEYGAKRIYEGQLAVLGDDPVVRHMAEQEEVHLAFFEKEIVARKLRPTALHPFWHFAGYALGALTARISRDGLHRRGRGSDFRTLRRPTGHPEK